MGVSKNRLGTLKEKNRWCEPGVNNWETSSLSRGILAEIHIYLDKLKNFFRPEL